MSYIGQKPAERILTSADLADASITQPKVATAVASTGPAFSAYANATQTVTNNVITKVVFQTKSFDTANCFDATTNYRFTPNVAGYYQFHTVLHLEGTVLSTQFVLYIAKNSASGPRLIDTNPSAALSSNAETTFSASAPLIYMNGTTDFVEVYGYYFGGTSTFSGTSASYQYSYFSGLLVKAA